MHAWRWLILILATIPVLFLTACEDGGDGDSAAAPAPAAPPAREVDNAMPTSTGSATDLRFPDGLHPDSGGDSIIAGVYAGFLPGTTGVTVVCFGDSITTGGYPGPLAGRTGMAVVDAGQDGERSEGGLSRDNEILQTYQPAYLCILYGANDVIGGVDASVTVGNLRGIVQAAKDNNCIPIVGTLTPMSGDRYGRYADDARATSAAIRGMGGVAIADLERAF